MLSLQSRTLPAEKLALGIMQHQINITENDVTSPEGGKKNEYVNEIICNVDELVTSRSTLENRIHITG